MALGGSAVAIKTQRYDNLDALVLEVGWAILTYKIDANGNLDMNDSVQFRSEREHSPCCTSAYNAMCPAAQSFAKIRPTIMGLDFLTSAM